MSLRSTVIDPFLKTSFDALLKLQEVIRCSVVIVALAYDWIETPNGERQTEIRDGSVG